jgi:two-component system OmpR family sensor kinase/two-component system sensor histidine kinase BaeS
VYLQRLKRGQTLNAPTLNGYIGMKPRLFGVMVLAFTLAIILGVAGMLGFVGLALVGVVPTEARDSFRDAPRGYAAILGDFYLANDRSWAGVEERLDGAPFSAGIAFFDYALTDTDGRVVASSAPEVRLGNQVPPERVSRPEPILARGERVGTLVLLRHASRQDATRRGPPEAALPFLRSIAAAGLALVLVLGGLGVLFSGWLSRPLRHLTAAAGELAAGQLDVQVRGAPVRELDDLAQAFNRMARALADADRQRRQLTADVAHELRTPLTIIKGRLEGLQDGVYPATPDQIARLLDEAALLERLIEDLRLLALAEAGQLPLFREPTDPAHLLHAAAAAFTRQAADQQIALHVEAAGELPEISADPQRMAQVFANLLANALRHTPEGGTITLRAERQRVEGRGQTDEGARPSLIPLPSALILLTVSDTGSGIAPADLPHIFDRFWRADRSRTRSSGGSGLGLAIVKQIVAAHGGSISAASEPGSGTTITIALPVAGL